MNATPFSVGNVFMLGWAKLVRPPLRQIGLKGLGDHRRDILACVVFHGRWVS